MFALASDSPSSGDATLSRVGRDGESRGTGHTDSSVAGGGGVYGVDIDRLTFRRK